jgi:hypothetical protein
MNYLASCFNFDQIANLKNHDGIKKKNNFNSIVSSGGNIGRNVGAGGGFGSAISGLATDRRPIKMKDYGLIKGGANFMNNQ